MSASKNYIKLFTKKQLIEEYNTQSVCSIAKKYNIPNTCMYKIFEKFSIKRRSFNTGGKLSSGYIHGRCSRIFRKKCLRCGKELSINPNAKHCIKCHNYLNSINKNRLIKLSKSIAYGWKYKNFAKLLHSKKMKYKFIWMRSSWEIKFAKWCDKNNIKWLYEPKTFDLGYTSYTPDFYLPERDIYIEIKGYLRKESKDKIKIFNRLYNNLIILNKQELIDMEVINER